jgi:hypothetical protein
MARQVFYSFHYKPDCARVSLVRNIGAIEANKPAHDNDWETIADQGDPAIERWIANQMHGRSCTVVMIGAETAGRKWINYEIEKTWSDRKGLVGVHIHNLNYFNQGQTTKGANPFARYTINDGKTDLSDVVKAYDPPYYDSKQVYAYIANNLEGWIDEAIKIRQQY